MKSTIDFLQELSSLDEFFGYDLSQCEQGSEEWHNAKLGVISASNVYKIVKKGRGKSGYSKERDTYMKELVAQVITKEAKEIKAQAMEWGKMYELRARSTFELFNDVVIEEIPFIFRSDDWLDDEEIEMPGKRCGVSLDGRIKGEDTVIEIKCPFNSTVYMDFVLDGKVKPEYLWQINFQMWVTGAKKAFFVNFDPRFTNKMFHGIELERDEEVMKVFDEEIPKFIKEMDEMLATFGAKFGQQWHKKEVA